MSAIADTIAETSLSHGAREGLVERFLPLARKLARRYHNGANEPLEDLVQVASVGLVKAARRYDEQRGVPFAAYASYAITGELKRHLRDHTWAVHVPRGAKDRALRVSRAIRDGSEPSGSAPSTSELARRLELSALEVVDARQAWLAREATSLDAPALDQDEGDPPSLAETIGSRDDGYQHVDHRLALDALLSRLPVRERRVVRMRFLEGRTQAEIAGRLGVSQMQVSRVLRRSLQRLELAGQDLYPL